MQAFAQDEQREGAGWHTHTRTQKHTGGHGWGKCQQHPSKLSWRPLARKPPLGLWMDTFSGFLCFRTTTRVCSAQRHDALDTPTMSSAGRSGGGGGREKPCWRLGVFFYVIFFFFSFLLPARTPAAGRRRASTSTRPPTPSPAWTLFFTKYILKGSARVKWWGAFVHFFLFFVNEEPKIEAEI